MLAARLFLQHPRRRVDLPSIDLPSRRVDLGVGFPRMPLVFDFHEGVAGLRVGDHEEGGGRGEVSEGAA